MEDRPEGDAQMRRRLEGGVPARRRLKRAAAGSGFHAIRLRASPIARGAARYTGEF